MKSFFLIRFIQSSPTVFRYLIMFPSNYPSLCIPRVFSNISEQKIRENFERMCFGVISRIDMVSKTSKRGEKFYRVFIHFHAWCDDEHTFATRMRLINGEEINIQYHSKYFWKVSAYRERISQNRPQQYPLYSVPQNPYLMQQLPYPMHYPQPPMHVFIPPQPLQHKRQVSFYPPEPQEPHPRRERSFPIVYPKHAFVHAPVPPTPMSSPRTPLTSPPRISQSLSPLAIPSPCSSEQQSSPEVMRGSNVLDPDETSSFENWHIDYGNQPIPKRRIGRKNLIQI